jgi:hypothetical protein
MRARHDGSGDGASMVVNEGGVQLVTAALRFSDALSINQVIDLTALGSRVRTPDPGLAEAIS